MSTATASWVDCGAATPSAPRRTFDRPQLRLVPPAAPTPERAVRLTRRGRLATTLLLVGLLATAALVMLPPAVASSPAIDHAVVVRAGQTLSELASLELPSLPNRQAVTQLQLANGMNSAQVQAGQTLLIPRLP